MDLIAVENFFLQTTPDLTIEVWWLPAVALVFLFIAAAVDAVKSYVPDPVIFFGLITVTALQGEFVSWHFAATHLLLALVAAIAIWGVNQLWWIVYKRDAIGMGDAKWTMLAAACFGLLPCLFAWGVGAVVAVLWMLIAKIARRKITHVHFAPFLFAGLCAGLYWLRFKGD